MTNNKEVEKFYAVVIEIFQLFKQEIRNDRAVTCF